MDAPYSNTWVRGLLETFLASRNQLHRQMSLGPLFKDLNTETGPEILLVSITTAKVKSEKESI